MVFTLSIVILTEALLDPSAGDRLLKLCYSVIVLFIAGAWCMEPCRVKCQSFRDTGYSTGES